MTKSKWSTQHTESGAPANGCNGNAHRKAYVKKIRKSFGENAETKRYQISWLAQEEEEEEDGGARERYTTAHNHNQTLYTHTHTEW